MLNWVKTIERRNISPCRMSNLEKDTDKQEPAQNWGQICCSLPRQNKQTGIEFPSLHPPMKTESEWPELWPEICAHVWVLMPAAGEQELTCPAHRHNTSAHWKNLDLFTIVAPAPLTAPSGAPVANMPQGMCERTFSDSLKLSHEHQLII